ncbi:DExH-box ATP-dependent RNA helicase DExH18 mitochondrial [Zea mays]|uniref:DExH-box ATP-dependent RNA helicase DExH18 mitochondrial n=1 Tax=Zea mays TaxID=4577 RepID=A0A1D6J829_MAIZE|nr:DExH-box ATP-dependent RNA helicase DExH18 mitochondrial [Zea mays]
MAADDLTPRDLMATADLTAPHTWYPSARAMRRRVVYHCGPTNSGKTHNALASFSAAKSGVYCSPLRLLTIEIFDKVKQIAGRAGRRSSVYPHGLATTFMFDLDYLTQCLDEPVKEAEKVGLFPTFEQLEMFATHFPELAFNNLLDKFRDTCRIDDTYFMCQHDSMKKVASMIESVQGLSLKDHYIFLLGSREYKESGSHVPYAEIR